MLNHRCWATLYQLSFYYLNHCFPLDYSSDSASKLKAPGFTPVWHGGMTVFSCSTPISIPGFCFPFILPSLLLLCIYFRQPALYNMGLQFLWQLTVKIMAHLDTQVSVTKGIILVICLLCTMFVLFGDIHQLCFYKCKLFFLLEGRWMVLKIFL